MLESEEKPPRRCVLGKNELKTKKKNHMVNKTPAIDRARFENTK